MRTSARTELPGRVSDAEALWYDQRRWPAFVDGFGYVTRSEGTWPEVGAVVLWASAPGGRGLVREEVVAYEVRAGATVAVEDESMRGRQTVAFAPGEMALTLEFELKRATRSARCSSAARSATACGARSRASRGSCAATSS